jgi:RNase P/RNase MRP subunit p29
MLKLKDNVKVLQVPKNSIDFSFEKLSLAGKQVNVVGMCWDAVFNEFLYAVYDNRLKVNQWFREKYLNLVEEENMREFKVGDRVRVVRKVERENGWENGWLPEMNMAINTSYVFTIADISKEGIYFKQNSSDNIEIRGYKLGYPPSSLELVETVESKIATSTNFQYLNGAKLGSGGPLSDLCLTILTTITKYPDGTAKVDWSVAFKHPKDKFNKELARQAVLTKETKELILSKGFNRNEIILKILADLLYHDAYLSSQYRAYVLFLVAQYSTNILRKALFK